MSRSKRRNAQATRPQIQPMIQTPAQDELTHAFEVIERVDEETLEKAIRIKKGKGEGRLAKGGELFKFVAGFTEIAVVVVRLVIKA